MNPTFEELLKIEYGTLFHELNFNATQIADCYYKVDAHKYIFAYEAESLGEIIYCGFVWVASEGVAEWIFTQNTLADDRVNIQPPVCLLPSSKINNYQSLVEYGRKVDPENFSDYVVRQTQVSFNEFRYYFRKCMPPVTDYPIAIEIDLRPWKNAKV